MNIKKVEEMSDKDFEMMINKSVKVTDYVLDLFSEISKFKISKTKRDKKRYFENIKKMVADTKFKLTLQDKFDNKMKLDEYREEIKKCKSEIELSDERHISKFEKIIKTKKIDIQESEELEFYIF